MELTYKNIVDINLSDIFFDSLREDYVGFDKWFLGKAQAGEKAYAIHKADGSVQGFLYLKTENGTPSDISPLLPSKQRVKVGTLKINAHGTKLGQRFVKKMIDWAVEQSTNELYVTVFDKHTPLVQLLERYGFKKWGIKSSASGTESVYIKRIGDVTGDLEKDYPLVDASRRVFMLGIYPKFHTKLFPDSKLVTESPDIIKDVSSSNSIHKIYICNLKGAETLKRNDVLIIYRTGDGNAAEYSAVATSVGVVEEYTSIHSFTSEAEFLNYCAPYSVFSDQELKEIWKSKRYPKIIRFTYNISLKKRPNRKTLIEEVGIDRSAYAGFMQLDSDQLKKIIKLGNVNEGLVIN